MAYPVTGVEAAVAWGSANFYSTMIAAFVKNSATLESETTVLDATPLGAAAAAQTVGLRQHSGQIRGHAFSAPRAGNIGIATWSGRYMTLLRGFDITIETTGVHEYTPLAIDPATATTGTPTDMVFRPDAVRWFGTIDLSADDTTPLVELDNAGDSAVSLVLTYAGSAAATLTGTAFATKLSNTAARNQLQTVQYGFSGTSTLVAAGASSIFGSYTFGSAVPIWHQGVALTGTTPAETLLTLTTSSNNTIKLDAFWKRIRLRCMQNELVGLEVDYQGNGPLTFT